MRVGKVLVVALMAACALALLAQDAPRRVTWTFDRLETIGGSPVRIVGNPRVIDTPVGKAIEFDGIDDALWIDVHPLAGAATFTFEAIFRPDGGQREQRWFHLAERDLETGLLTSEEHARTGKDDNARVLFEIRVINENRWCLDAFVNGPGYSKTLMFRDKLYPIRDWYHVAQVFDGRMFRSYVNGELQGEAEIDFRPQGPGATSIGMRINKVSYFRGAVAKARFTPKALPVTEFMKLPQQEENTGRIP